MIAGLAELKTQAHRAAQLDPLRLDEFFATPRWTSPRAARALLRDIRTRPWLPGDPAAALATVRDLHLLMCVVERDTPGRTLIDMPWLDPLLAHLGQVSGRVPCGDNACYGWANRAAPRTRTYTEDPREPILYWGLGHGESLLDELLDALVGAAHAWPGPRVAVELQRAVAAWEPMVEAVRAMHRHGVAEFMGRELAPWVSHSFEIAGRVYRGPTAAQLPVILIDFLLWGYDCDDAEYREYARYYIGEQPKARRMAVAGALHRLGSRSLLTAAERDGMTGEAWEAFELLLRRMFGFRRSHRVLATASLPIRPAGEEAWGTGQFDPSMLDVLLTRTADARARAARS